MIRIKISEDALQDLRDGYLFYEAQQSGLGDYFTTCLRADVESLKIYAGIHRIVYEDYHRLLSRVFPYGVFYTIKEGCAVVWAVIDLRRDPEWMRRKLSG